MVYAKHQRKTQRERGRERVALKFLFTVCRFAVVFRIAWEAAFEAHVEQTKKPKSAVIKKPQIDNESRRKRRHKKKQYKKNESEKERESQRQREREHQRLMRNIRERHREKVAENESP